jgi:hypothetical protein
MLKPSLLKNNIKSAANSSLRTKKRGRFSDYKKIERGLTSFWHAYFLYHTPEKAKNQTAFELQGGFSFTKPAF